MASRKVAVHDTEQEEFNQKFAEAQSAVISAARLVNLLNAGEPSEAVDDAYRTALSCALSNLDLLIWSATGVKVT